MARYDQYCPIAHASEVLSERWTFLIVRELLYGEHRFTDLERGLPGISRSLLARRLDALEHHGLIERRVGPGGGREGYWLTERGQALDRVVESLGEWGAIWSLDGEPAPDELDPKVLMWFMHRRLAVDELPAARTVIRFDFRGTPRSFWLVLERPSSSVCTTNPGYQEDLVVDADLRRLYRAWFGHERLADVIDAGAVVVEGDPVLAKRFPRWLRFSHFAPVVRQRLERAGVTV